MSNCDRRDSCAKKKSFRSDIIFFRVLANVPDRCPWSQVVGHTPSIAFRHLPPNSARFSYATEGALFISAQLSTDAVSALRKFEYTDKPIEAT